MKLTIANTKPRNPLVAAARMRQAGRHDSHDKSQRQRHRNELRRSLQRAGSERDDP